MMKSSAVPDPLQRVCRQWSEVFQQIPETQKKINYVLENLPDLLSDKSLFRSILRDVQDGAAYPDIRRATMFDNEIMLYLDSQRQFSVRLYLWGPGKYTPIHDHSSWGVIGTVSESLEIVKYERTDNGSEADSARIQEKERLTLRPGELDVALPLNKGIHKTGNPGKRGSITLHIYGKPIRRPYINLFDLMTGSVGRLYPPKTYKRMLASEALLGLEPSTKAG
ncbi:MAG: cysteine dioxygenase family protein [Desulfatiglans sp.]|nr:cysteine dioxygenase family protein [Thermodesulfobacteriota bacterium]MEE4352412.1 cysteine dioxygenase family protein [Desulfatiglans sp.]